jgi:hypothetical protein
MIKLAGLLLLISCASGLWGQNSRIYGDFSAQFLQVQNNLDYLNYVAPADDQTDHGQMVANVSSSLYGSFRDDSMGIFFAELSIFGSLAATAGTTLFSDSAIPPELLFAVRQLYVQAPIAESLYLTVGKKPVNFGAANYFNVANRLSPKNLPPLVKVDGNPALAALDWQLADWLALGGYFYFTDSNTWDKTAFAMSAQAQVDALTVDVYGYLEQLSKPYLGYAASMQLDRLQIYAEGILSNQPSQPSLRSDAAGLSIADDFVSTELDHVALQQVVGLSLTTDVATFALEYMYRSEGLGNTQRSELFGYIDGLGNYPLRAEAIQNVYTQNRWDAHYAALTIDGANIINDLVKPSFTLLASAGPDLGDWYENASFLGRFKLTFMPSKALHLTGYLQASVSGVNGEQARFSPTGLIGGIVCWYSFSSGSF